MQFQPQQYRTLANTLQQAIQAAQQANKPQIVEALRHFGQNDLGKVLAEDNPQFKQHAWNQSIEPGAQITV